MFRSAVIVAAHPDDEAIGLGALLPQMQSLAAIVHVTDGAPRNGGDARSAGCERWEQYAALRTQEFEKGLAISGGHSGANICLDCADQQAAFRIAELARALAGVLDRLGAKVVFTHPYEGGHPDHDATAAAVSCARRLSRHPFTILEFSSYHAEGDRMACECFLENGSSQTITRRLDDEQRRRKREILDCYASQRRVLEQFPLSCEPLRVAPEYDFTMAPHAGTLYYERFDWGVRGKEWRTLAAQAFRQLGIQ